jgi:hypothetical protein
MSKKVSLWVTTEQRLPAEIKVDSVAERRENESSLNTFS